MSIDLAIDHLVDAAVIGQGGFGTVYAATDTRFERRVAVKVLQRLTSERDRQAFDRECKIMGRMSVHPNVVTVHEAGYSRLDCPYLIMELIEGGSLAQRLQSTGPVAWLEAVGFVIPVADALGLGHGQGIEHRDVKPDNILVAGAVPRLTDFGIARLRDATGSTSTQITASWLHAPPETFENKRDHRSDIYSLVSTLQTLITGRAPFFSPDDESLSPLMFRLLTVPAPRLPPELGPPGLADLLQAGLSKAPGDRPQSTNELIAELRRVAAPYLAQHDHSSTWPVATPPSQSVTVVAPQPVDSDARVTSALGDLREATPGLPDPSTTTTQQAVEVDRPLGADLASRPNHGADVGSRPARLRRLGPVLAVVGAATLIVVALIATQALSLGTPETSPESATTGTTTGTTVTVSAPAPATDSVAATETSPATEPLPTDSPATDSSPATDNHNNGEPLPAGAYSVGEPKFTPLGGKARVTIDVTVSTGGPVTVLRSSDSCHAVSGSETLPSGAYRFTFEPTAAGSCEYTLVQAATSTSRAGPTKDLNFTVTADHVKPLQGTYTVNGPTVSPSPLGGLAIVTIDVTVTAGGAVKATSISGPCSTTPTTSSPQPGTYKFKFEARSSGTCKFTVTQAATTSYTAAAPKDLSATITADQVAQLKKAPPSLTG